MSLRQIALLLALSLSALPASAQEMVGPRRQAAPLPSPIDPVVAVDGPAGEWLAAPGEGADYALAGRSKYRYPLIRMAVGAAIGFGVAVYLHSGIEPGTDLAGPPAYFLTVPAGAIGGLILGFVANELHPPNRGAASAAAQRPR